MFVAESGFVGSFVLLEGDEIILMGYGLGEQCGVSASSGTGPSPSASVCP